MRAASAPGEVLVHPIRMILTTRRLTLRPVAADDAPSLHELWSSAGVRRFLWDDESIPMARTRAAVDLSHQLFEARRHGLWCARLKDAPELCGFGGLWPFRDPPEFELVYGVAERLWGRGHATEIAEAIVRHCTRTLGMPAVRASTDIGNVASIRVLEKLGFRLLERRTAEGLDTVFYEWQGAVRDSGGDGAADPVEGT